MGSPGRMHSASLIERLLDAPQQFDFVQAMELLEAVDAGQQRFGAGLDQRVRLRPSEELVFPASDIRDCQADGDGLTLIMAFFGLYGIDAPVPHYLLDRTTAADDDAARLRQFLDVFNQRFYVLLYRAMQISRPAAGQLPAAFRGCAGALAGQLDQSNGRRRFPVGRIRTAAGLAALVADHFPDIAVQVEDRRPAWQPLGNGCLLQGDQCRLGDNTILGGQAYVASGSVAVRLGPLDAADAQTLLPGQARGQQLQDCIDSYLSAQVDSELHIRVRPSQHRGDGLGSDGLRLGWSVWLGEDLQDEYLIRVANNASGKGGQSLPAATN